jgi:hypothetical protein
MTSTDPYLLDGERRAHELGNRGRLAFDAAGGLHRDITEAYWRTGFYVFAGVLSEDEQEELRDDCEGVLDRAPVSSTSATDAHGRPALGQEKEIFSFARPLSDPLGGIGRYMAKMAEHEVPAGEPDEVITTINLGLRVVPAFFRLYGHPQLLRVAEQINGADFTPFNESIRVKPAHLGTSTAWHQDGTTHWDSPELDAGTHGFNFMTQLYATNATNALWVVPKTHDVGKIDIPARVAANGGSDRLPGAVPMLCEPGDVAICNRQSLHASFANLSDTTRVTLIFGFHRRRSVLGVQKEGAAPYDEERIRTRARILALAIDARQQRFPDEERYHYQPLADELADIRWDESTRDALLKDYFRYGLSI